MAPAQPKVQYGHLSLSRKILLPSCVLVKKCRMELTSLPATRSTVDRAPISCRPQRHKMAALVGVAPNLRAVLAAHVPLQFVDGRRLRPAHDVQRHSLMRVAAKAADLKVEISRVQSVAEARRGLSRSFESEHALVPGDTRQPVSFLPSLGRALRRMPDRTAVNAFARLGAHQGKNAPAWRRSASRYGLGSTRSVPLPVADAEKPPGCPAAISRRAAIADAAANIPSAGATPPLPALD